MDDWEQRGKVKHGLAAFRHADDSLGRGGNLPLLRDKPAMYVYKWLRRQ